MNESKLAKIAISFAADAALTESLTPVNVGFEGGRITKAEMASWYILEGVKRMDAAAVERVRKEYFDELAYLGSLMKRLKKARANGVSDLDAEESLKRLSPASQKVAKAPKVAPLSKPDELQEREVA